MAANAETAQPTPGPWTITLPPEPVAVGDGYLIKSKKIVGNWNGYVTNVLAGSPNAEANARLIVAAPDMLAALKSIEDTSFTMAESLNLVRAAIAKAEGRDV